MNTYIKIIKLLGNEFKILIDTPISKIENFDENIALVIKAFRNNEIKYTPGGGGTYGQIKFDFWIIWFLKTVFEKFLIRLENIKKIE